MSDNEILMHGMIKMRQEFLEITKKDPIIQKQNTTNENNEQEMDESFMECEFSANEEEEDGELGQVTNGIKRAKIDGNRKTKEYCGGFDILLLARTIASAAMKIFQLLYS